MKKFVLALLALIAILLIILYLKMNGTIPAISPKTTTTEKYSNVDIEALILKGVENFDNLSNVTYEFENISGVTKRYYRGTQSRTDVISSKEKQEIPFTYYIANAEGKKYFVNEKNKTILVSKDDFIKVDKGIQYTLENIIKNNAKTNSSDKMGFQYVQDITLEGKDCILVKEQLYSNGNAVPGSYTDEDLSVFWIEKETGFVLATGSLQTFKDTGTPASITRNIAFGTVKDSDFELPTGYKIIEQKQK